VFFVPLVIFLAKKLAVDSGQFSADWIEEDFGW
jgi:hypothetical protein